MRADAGKDRGMLGWLDADDRRAIFDEAAGAATDTGIAYWLVLVLALSVALVPPLAVAGFAIGTGGNWAVLRGSLLLYGANLAGIVMSAMLVFLVAGMHRPAVLAEVRRWHSDAPVSGLAAWAERLPGVRSLGVLRSLPARLILVLAFVALVAIRSANRCARSRARRAFSVACNWHRRCSPRPAGRSSSAATSRSHRTPG